MKTDLLKAASNYLAALDKAKHSTMGRHVLPGQKDAVWWAGEVNRLERHLRAAVEDAENDMRRRDPGFKEGIL